MKMRTARIYDIPEISKRVAPIARQYGVAKLSLFGSYARGEAEPHSDIDLRIIKGGNLRSLIHLAGFIRELENSLGIQVDVLTNDALNEGFLSHIKDDEIVIYDE